jgi:hypothetical protein
MLRAERGDTIEISGDKYEVFQRTDPYFGPKLKLRGPNGDAMLTCPAPDTQLMLWEAVVDADGFRMGWERVGETTAELVDTKQYDICEKCGEPLKTVEHRRRAIIGACEP